MFYIIWALKESFIKAVGIGLGYSLDKVQRCYTRAILSEPHDRFLSPCTWMTTISILFVALLKQ
jgi:phosphopantetheinyl transferase